MNSLLPWVGSGGLVKISSNAGKAVAVVEKVAEKVDEINSVINRIDKERGKFKFTGAGITELDDAAEAAYKLIRNSRLSDVHNVSKNTGLSIEEVTKLKKHLFFGKHQIPVDGGKTFELARFSADDEIAYAWKTAPNSPLSSRQQAWFRQLADHELGERKLMAQGIPYRRLESWDEIRGFYTDNPGGAHKLAPKQPEYASFEGFEIDIFNF